MSTRARSGFTHRIAPAVSTAGLAALLALGLGGCAGPERPSLPPVQASVGRELEEASLYQIGQDRAVLTRAEALVTKAVEEGRRREMEDQLLAVLTRPGLTDGGRDFVLRALQQVASGVSVPYLEPFLNDPKWGMQSLAALASIPGSEAELTLLRAMSTAEGQLRLTLVGVAGQRRMVPAVTVLSGFVRSEDETLILAALKALGEIGDPKAYFALRGNAVSERLQAQRLQAVVVCLSLISRDETKAAPVRATLVQGARELLRQPQPVGQRASLLRSLVLLARDGAATELLEGLRSPEPELSQTATKTFLECSDAGLVKAVVEAWTSLPLSIRGALLEGLSAAHDVQARALALEALRGGDRGLKLSALKALAQVGTREDFAAVFALVEARVNLAPEAAACLAALKAPGIDDELRARLAKATPELASVILEIGANRQDPQLFDQACALIESGQAADPTLHQAALEALAALAKPSDVSRLCGILLNLNQAGEVQTVARALRRVIAEDTAPGQDCQTLILASKQANPIQRRVLRQVLAAMSLPEAVQFMADSISRGTEEDWRDQVRILGSSAQFAHVDTLMAQLPKAVGTANRVLVLRCLINLIHQSDEVASSRRADAYLMVWPQVIEDEDRLVIIGDMEKWRPETARSLRSEAKLQAN